MDPSSLVTAEELSSRTFPPPDFLVDRLIPKGLSLLAGEPKIGKSWLALDIATSISRGVGCLGERACRLGDVLYLALEDSDARLHGRLSMMLGHCTWPASLTLATDWPRLDEGGADALLAWAQKSSQPRAIIIDVFERIRSGSSRSSYQGAYEEISRLRAIANAAQVGIILVHHLTKGAPSSDPHQRIHGTVGVFGAVDTSLVLVRGRTATRLLARGRDIEEVDEIVAFDRHAMCWRPVSGQQPVSLYPERDRVIRFLAERGQPVSPAEVAAELQVKSGTVRRMLRRMDEAGEIIRTGYGAYVVAGQSAANDAA